MRSRGPKPVRPAAAARRAAALQRRLWSAVALAAMLPMSVQAAADEDSEFAPFRITDVWGTVVLRYHRDDVDTRRVLEGPEPATLSNAQSDHRAEVSATVSARGFVYHPKFLVLDLGLGAIYQNSRVGAEVNGSTLSNHVGKGLYDLSLRGVFFRGEPYSGTVFYEHLNPSVTVGPAMMIVQTQVRRGFDLRLLEPIVPVRTTLEASVQQSQGRGSGLVVDEHSERFGLSAARTFGSVGFSRLRIDRARQDSSSGSADLPIVRSTNDSSGAGLDTRLQFGADQQVQLTNLLTYGTLRYGLGAFRPADRKDARATLDLRSRHSAALHTSAALDASRVEQGALHNQSVHLNLGLSWLPLAGLSTAAELRGERVRTSEFSSSLGGASASTNYQWSIGGGSAQIGYAARYDSRSQTAAARVSSVIGERHVLAGVSFVALTWPNVSVLSVRVSNESRSQQYREGRDYLVSVLGTQLRLQRVVSGDITDGQSVLVDYDFDTGGSYDATIADHTANLIWSWRNRFSVFMRHFESLPQLTAGIPTTPLNRVRSRTYGARAEWPVAKLWTVGANVEDEDRRETVLPYRRKARDLFVVWEEGLFGPGGLRLDARRLRVTYDFSSRDVDLTGFDLRYWVYTPAGIEWQFDWNSERDIGAATPRRRDLGSLRARWRFRQMQMTLSLTRTREEQGLVSTRRTLGQWQLQRSL